MIGTKFAKPLEMDKLYREVNQQSVDENGDLKTIAVQKAFDNPAPNTLSRYCEAAEWCNRNGALLVERAPDVEFPQGFYEVMTTDARKAEELAAMTEDERVELALAQAKAKRAAAVATITVEVDGLIFDGDEKAQERMSRAVVLADSADETTEWVLHDNTVAIVTADQLRRACKLAGKAQTELWTVPYEA